MEEKKIVYLNKLNDENINKVLTYLMDNTLGYKGSTIDYLEDRNCLHVYLDGKIDEYLEVEEDLEETLKIAISKIDLLFKDEEKEEVEVEEDKSILEEKEEEVVCYKGKHKIFKRMYEYLILVKALVLFFAVIQVISIISLSSVAGSLLYGVLSSVGTILEIVLLIFLINYLLNIVMALMDMDEDIEELKQK